MKATHSPLGLVLDRSGSMSSCVEAAISATNAYSGKAKALHTAAYQVFNCGVETPPTFNGGTLARNLPSRPTPKP